MHGPPSPRPRRSQRASARAADSGRRPAPSPIEMADAFFSSSWRIRELHGCSGISLATTTAIPGVLCFSACFWRETSPVDGLCCVNVDGVQCISEYQRGACQSSNGQGSRRFARDATDRPLPHRGSQEGPGLTVRRPSGPGPGRRVMHHRTRRDRHHQQEPARLDDRTARRCDLLHEPGSYDLARLRTNGLITRIPGKNRYRPAHRSRRIQQRPGRLPRGSGPARPGLRVPVHICGRRPQRAGPPRRRPRLR